MLHQPYRYFENSRLQLFFSTPNECAAILAAVILVLVSYGVFCSKRNDCLLVGATVLSLAYCLGKTYSRSGSLALGVGLLLFFTVLKKRERFRLILSGLLIAAGFLFVPLSVQRLGSIAEIDDLSVSNRLKLWGSSCRFIIEHPRGEGIDGFYYVYNVFYKDETLRPRYRTAVNTYLTIAAHRGIFSLMAVMFFLGGLWSLSLNNCMKTPNWVALATVGALSSFAVSAFFNTFLNGLLVVVLLFFLLLSSILVVKQMMLRKNLDVRRFLGIAVFSPLGTYCLIWLVSVLYPLSRDVRGAVVFRKDCEGRKYLYYSPIDCEKNRTVIVGIPNEMYFQGLSDCIVPLASGGNRVIGISLSPKESVDAGKLLDGLDGEVGRRGDVFIAVGDCAPAIIPFMEKTEIEAGVVLLGELPPSFCGSSIKEKRCLAVNKGGGVIRTREYGNPRHPMGYFIDEKTEGNVDFNHRSIDIIRKWICDLDAR